MKLIRRSRVLVKPSVHPRRALISSSNVPRYPRRDLRPRLTKRDSSSTPIASPNPLPGATPSSPENPSEPPAEDDVETEKPKRKARTTAQKDPEAIPQLPPSLNILWTPEPASETLFSANLPPPDIFNEILDNLHVTLHPQRQHKATYSSPTGPPVEPTFALYCPIEGGDYILDETVHELARRTGSDVVVLDAVQLAAGESGQFGKAASVLQLPENPLHFPAAHTHHSTPSRSYAPEEEDEEPGAHQMMPSSSMTVHVLAPAPSRSSRPAAPKTPSKLKAFFDELINTAAPASESGEPSATPRKPRLVYIRDFPTLAASSATWYPALLSSVRQRRAGAINRSSSPIPNPMTIIFGMTPPITPTAHDTGHPSSNGPNQGLTNMLMNRQSPTVTPSGLKPGKPEWSEDESSDRARERRLRERLRKWESGNSHLLDELPSLMTGAGEEDESSGLGRKMGMVLLGGQPMSPLPSILSGLMPRLTGQGSPTGDSAPRSDFYRTSILVPSVRSPADERLFRVARRREINELTLRMAIAAAGGTLGPLEYPPAAPADTQATEASAEGNDVGDMWEDWGKSIGVWPVVRQIADRAVGSAVEQNLRESSGMTIPKFTLDPTPISWSAVSRAWAARKSVRGLKKTWVDEAFGRSHREEDEMDPLNKVDEVIERIKQDPELDQHEQRLLGCIVDPRSLTSTFEQVHLPAHTVDSVRSIVSLPLLYPAAFQHGILKEHGITGCVLFGPPGTGKTLIVRALAKEAECRMLAIAPSDVMDMYVGEGEKLVKAVFSLARRLSPCVVFIDEIDSLFGARMSSRETGGALAHRGVITEFMSEMDGLRSSRDDSVIVIGATNRPFDLDDAVLRRLPRRLLVDLPGEKEREEILKILLREEVLGPDVDFNAIAKKTENFSGSDLKHLCVSAALDAVKSHITLPWSPKVVDTTLVTALASEAPVETPTTEVASSEVEAEVEAAAAALVLESDNTTAEPAEQAAEEPPARTRVLSLANFTKALKEITPSSSEALGSLGALRKWNDEFGEGKRNKRKTQWGKGSFGFADKATPEPIKIGAEGAPGLSSSGGSRT